MENLVYKNVLSAAPAKDTPFLAASLATVVSSLFLAVEPAVSEMVLGSLKIDGLAHAYVAPAGPRSSHVLLVFDTSASAREATSGTALPSWVATNGCRIIRAQYTGACHLQATVAVVQPYVALSAEFLCAAVLAVAGPMADDRPVSADATGSDRAPAIMDAGQSSTSRVSKRLSSVSSMVSLESQASTTQSVAPLPPSETPPLCVVCTGAVHELPGPPDGPASVDMKLSIQHIKASVLASQRNKDTRAIAFEIDADVRMTTRAEDVSVAVDVCQLAVLSYCVTRKAATRRHVLAPTSVSICAEKRSVDLLELDLSIPSLDVSIGFSDVALLANVITGLVPLEALRPRTHWDERPFPLSAYTATQDSTMGTGHGTVPSALRAMTFLTEKASVEVPAVNVTVLDDLDDFARPVLVFSSSVSASVNNWSSALQVLASVTAAIALYHAPAGVWEPFLVGSSDDYPDAVIPVQCELRVRQKGSEWFAMKTATIAGSSKRSRHAEALLVDSTSATEWIGGRARGPNWVIVDFGRVVTMDRFRFRPSRVRGGAPLDCQLFVGDSVSDVQRTSVCRWQSAQPPTSGSAPFFVSPEFSGTGRYWKWVVHTRWGNAPAQVRCVGFRQLGIGMEVVVNARSGIEVTLTTTAIRRLLRDVAALMDVLSDDVSVLPSADIANIIGGTMVHNLLSNDVAIALADGTVTRVGAGQISTVIMTPSGPSASKPSLVAVDDAASNPIVDMVVIDEQRERPPVGWHVVRKPLSFGQYSYVV